MVPVTYLAKLLLASTLTFGGFSYAAAIKAREPQVISYEPRAATGSALANFCAEFKATCSDVCLNGKTGSTEIVFACVKNSDGTLGLGCRCDGSDSTRSALAKVAQPDPTATKLVTQTTTTTLKSTTTSTQLVTTRKGTTTLHPTKTTTVSEGNGDAALVVTISAVVTPTVTSGTLSLTSADETYTYFPYTNVVTTIFTTTSTSYSTAGTATFSTLSLANNDRRAVEHAPLQASVEKRDKVSTTFCSAFSSACTANCKAAGSSISSESCSKESNSKTADNYSLLCTCKDGSSPSLHALQDVVTGGTTTQSTTRTRTRSSTVSKRTTITETTARSTVVKPTTKTVTNTLNGGTSTITKVVSTAPTVTVPKTTTVDTGRPDGYGENYVVKTYSCTRTEISYATLTVSASASTTLNVLAPTGRVRADKADGNGGTTSGYMASSNGFWFPGSQPGYGIPYGLVQLPPDGTGIDSYYLANMRTIGNVVANTHGALTQWSDTPQPSCSGSSAFDTAQIGSFYIVQPFRLGATQTDTINPDRAYEVPLLPHLINYNQEVISPAVFQDGSGSAVAWATQADCSQDSSVAVNSLFFEPLS